MVCEAAYLEEILCRAVSHDTIFDLRLFGEIVRRLDGRLHSLHGKEGGQISSVGRDDDESEEPPHAADYTARYGSVKRHNI